MASRSDPLEPAADPVAALLIARGRLSAADRERAQDLSRSMGLPLEAVLSRLGLVSDADMAEAMADALRLPRAAAADFPDPPLLRERITPAFLRNACVLPLRESEEGLDLAMANPRDDFTVNALRMIVGKPIRRFVAARGEIERALDRAAGPAASPLPRGLNGADRDTLADAASGAPAIAFVQGLLTDAVRARASDIHLEPADGALALRLRVDGRLKRLPDPPAGLAEALIGRIKVMAGLDIAERRLPQDGRLRASVDGREIDIRVSIVPTMSGEAVVLRLLDRAHLKLDVAALGFAPAIAESLAALAERPNGIILATGPTGSGKTTTLYALLSRLNKPDVKILAIEDPVEFRLPGINQVQVRHRIGLDFPRVMRAFLRHDPDIMMVGEIRDTETARIAIQAALTGHLILSTLHTNDAPGAIARLLDMEVEPFLLAATLNGVLAQRLVRLLCPHCRAMAAPNAAEARFFAAQGAVPAAIGKAKGCAACGQTGYLGRAAIGELLVVDDDLRAMITARADHAALRAVGRARGMLPLLGSGLALVAEGRTTLDEVLRAVPSF